MKREENLSFLSVKKAQKGLQMHFMALKEIAFVIYFKNSAFTAVKRDTKSYTRYVQKPITIASWYVKAASFVESIRK